MVDLGPKEPERAFQKDTSVTRAHRGRGLGLAMKPAMLELLAAENPVLERIHTGTSTQNTHMIAIDHALGFGDLYVSLSLAHTIGELWRRISPQPANAAWPDAGRRPGPG